MAYGDVLVHTNGPSYGQNIVRNVGTAGGGGGGAPDAHAASHEDGGSDELNLTGLSGGFQNPYPDPVTFSAVADFLQDIEMRDGKTIWLDDAKTVGFRYDAASQEVKFSGEDIEAAGDFNLKAANGDMFLGASGDGGAAYILIGSDGGLVVESTGELHLRGSGTDTFLLELKTGFDQSGKIEGQGSGASNDALWTLSGRRFDISVSELVDFGSIPIQLTHMGGDPGTPANGMIWTTAAGVRAHINGVTVQLAVVP